MLVVVASETAGVYSSVQPQHDCEGHSGRSPNRVYCHSSFVNCL